MTVSSAGVRYKRVVARAIASASSATTEAFKSANFKPARGSLSGVFRPGVEGDFRFGRSFMDRIHDKLWHARACRRRRGGRDLWPLPGRRSCRQANRLRSWLAPSGADLDETIRIFINAFPLQQLEALNEDHINEMLAAKVA